LKEEYGINPESMTNEEYEQYQELQAELYNAIPSHKCWGKLFEEQFNSN